MCGIAGAVDLEGRRDFPVQRLSAMTGALAHRGPDDEHFHVEPGVALGARRLALIDPAGGRQPMANETDDIWVAQEGELYEYPELRVALLARGHVLRTRCDTEAWVHLYEDFGDEVFRHARGQFAVSIWDARTRTLVLGRDRAGIAPLFYARSGGWLLWASEAKGLFASGLVEPTADRLGIDFFFNYFAVAPERTCFEAIRQVPPGCCLVVRGTEVSLRRYADLDFPRDGEERQDLTEDEAAEELEALLRDAIRRRLAGEGGIGIYVSGGVDSTSLLKLALDEAERPIQAATVGLEDAGRVDEEPPARSAATALGSRLLAVRMSALDICETLPELVAAAESPVLDASAACMVRLAQAVRADGCKMVLSGEGADEALAGYEWFKEDPAALQPGGAVDSGIRRAFPDSFGHDETPAVGSPSVQTGQALISASRSVFYSKGMRRSVDGYSARDELGFNLERMATWHPLNRSLYAASKVMLAGMLLSTKGDRPAHNAGIEGRFPFLDERFVDFCAQLPPRYKLNGSTDKWLLRRVARKLLPPEVPIRPKTMFQAKVTPLLTADGLRWVDQLLSPGSIQRTGYFDHAGIEAARGYLAKTPARTLRRQGYVLGLIGVVTTQLWHHTFLGGGLADLPQWQPPKQATPASP